MKGIATHPAENTPDLEFAWLVRLRWWISLILLASLFFIHASSFVEMNLWASLGVVLIYWLSNGISYVWFRKTGEASTPFLGLTMTVDVILITLLLLFSGGAHNPFSFLYLVPVTTSVLLLPQIWSWSLLFLSVLGYGTLFLFEVPLAKMDHSMQGQGHLLHLYGMWIAFGLSALYIVYFMLHINRALKARTEALETYRRREQRNQHITSLGTLAAGAAHELSTPLSTIAVIAKELEHELKKTEPQNEQSIEDTATLRAEVNRCREILQKMGGHSEALVTDTPEPLVLLDYLDPILNEKNHPIELKNRDTLQGKELSLPRETLRIVLENVLKNAVQSSRGKEPVEVEVLNLNDVFEVRVTDAGEGLDPKHSQRIGEPFFTTKKVGEGMGLGIYLSRAILEHVGGELILEPAKERGTRAIIRFPLRAET